MRWFRFPQPPVFSPLNEADQLDLQDQKGQIILTNIAPHRDNDVHVIPPNYGVYEDYEIAHRDPYRIAPHRKAELSRL